MRPERAKALKQSLAQAMLAWQAADRGSHVISKRRSMTVGFRIWFETGFKIVRDQQYTLVV